MLEITAPLFPLEGVLLLALASSTIALSAEDRARVGGTLCFTSLGSLATFGLASASGLAVTNPVVYAVVVLTAATAFLGSRATSAMAEPLALFKSDARGLVGQGADADGEGSRASAAAGPVSVSNFYRSSTITGLLVGAAFIFSPTSPIAVFETEAPATHLMRQDLGLYIVALLCPIQCALYRAARDGSLGEASTRALNTATGVAIALLVLDGKMQVDIGSELFKQLPADSPLVALVASAGDASRPEANTTAAFSVGFLVALVYLYQAAFNKDGQEADPAR